MKAIFVILFMLISPFANAQGLVFQGDGGSSFTNAGGTSFGSGLQALQDRRELFAPKTIIELTRQRDGHFYADLTINGKPIRFLVDTGASNIALSKEDARSVGIITSALVYSGRAQTANGVVNTAQINLRSISLGEAVEYDFPATVLDADITGSLLGMRFLNTFSRIDIQGDSMFLHL